ncbi:hypothetical protein KZ483_27725 [Paenibacillus sp. sptzw28]|uniref:DUF5696 domain-containing protein n=1 Tax=Paenibacillus sp. sptzw28 TaxID=715179 RepID=UPI001C6DD65D|nr:DUF5696 domain-containing protein [Paenibacillus sp. sptzw28]QYR21414.1 hypothetical protein KZ483_27725 [Paenibacillus sp. sptzw28]
MKLSRKKNLLLAAVVLLSAVSVPLFWGLGTSGKSQETASAAPAGSASKEGGESPAAVPAATAAPAAAEAAVKPAASGASGGTDVNTGSAAKAAQANKTPVKATKLAAQNDKYELYVSESDGQVRVVSKQSGKEWFSAPPLDKTVPPNNVRLIESPVTVRYTQGKNIETTYPSKAKAKTNVKAIESGVRFEYDMAELGISFALEYRLTDNGFEARIPFDSVKETGAIRLTSIEMLPFLEAADPGERGAIFVPDGSGAIMAFKPVREGTFESYSQFIYGGDYAFQTNIYEKVVKVKEEMMAKPPSEKIALPVYGLYKEDKGFLGIVTDGDSNARINATPAGIRNINLYRAAVEFLYRNEDIIFVGKSGDIPMIEKSLIEGDRAVRYVLLEDDQANYVGMAKAYRLYLTEDQGVKPIETDRSKLQLQLFGGGTRDEIIGSTFIQMTTFEQARTIVDGFLKKGVTSLEVTYDAWSDGGKYGEQPKQFPAEGKLGGNKELKKLADYLKGKGIALYLKANYVKPYTTTDEVKASRDAVRGLNNEVMKVYRPWLDNHQMSGDTFYLLKPQRVFDHYISEEADKYAQVGADGVVLENMGSTVYSDHAPFPPFRRGQTIGIWQKSMELMREKTGHAATDYGFAYAFGRVDRIDGAPIDSSQFVYMDRAVPFYQIVVHGLIPYTAEPFNLQDDPRVHLLRLLEYGAMPSYELTYADPSELKRTPFDSLFSGRYDDWTDQAIDVYRIVSDVVGKVSKQAIIGHEQLQKNVYRTTYEDGTYVTVNYNRKPVQVDGMQLEAYGYSVTKGGGA